MLVNQPHSVTCVRMSQDLRSTAPVNQAAANPS